MTLSAGTMLGPYRITSLIGSGGMGEVYKAVDSRLGRTVAVKVLPSDLASDADRRQRFELEARAISSLNHPRIAALYDVGEQAGTPYLVMELVDGQTLADRLLRGKLPLSQALEYAVQIADALEDAHRNGIVHRDLKPGNVMITGAGVKLLDFGLAKLRDGAKAASQEPAATIRQRSPLTSEGTILGTVQYMAPEQLEGADVDARADIFSFGAIVYEMLSGKPAFAADSAAGLTAAILTADPSPMSTLAAVPPALEHVVSVCLAKKRDDRWQTAHDVRKQLEWIRMTASTLTAPAATVPGKRRWVKISIASAAVLVAVAIAVGLTYRPRPLPSGQLMRLTVSFNRDVRYVVGEDFRHSASISPDGRRIVFTGADQETGTARLYIRPIDSEQITPIEGSEEGTHPFWSPDSQSIGFRAHGKVKLADLDGGRARDLTDTAGLGGASWNDDGRILISLADPGPLVLLPAAGGPATPATVLDASQEVDHDSPQFLDDGTHFLYLARGPTTATSKVYFGELGSTQRTLLLEGTGAFTYAPPNRVLFLKRGTLFAQELDTRRFVLVGAPVALAEDAVPPFSASRNGTLTYRTVPSTPNPLLWIRPDGSEIGTALPPGYYVDPAISPDGTQVAVASRESPDDTFDVAILDLASGAQRKLTVDRADDRSPVWSPDGQSIVFVSLRPEAPGLYRKNANGVGGEQLVLAMPPGGVWWPYQWTRGHLFYFGGPSLPNNDIWMMSPEDVGEPTLLLKTQPPFTYVDGALSPDGNWFAYVTNQTGRYELYLTSFPPSSTQVPITTEGASDPAWSPDGTRLYYTRPSTAELMSMSVTPGQPPVFGPARRIHSGPLEYPSGHSIDVDPTQERLLIAPSYGVLGDITVLVNW
jgi:eukaryotic-like serine/threonine-protein kinase